MKILLLANCQGMAVKQILEAAGEHQVIRRVPNLENPELQDDLYLAGFDAILAQDIRQDLTSLWEKVYQHERVVRFPALFFYGFSADQVGIPTAPGSGIGEINFISRIMSAAWRRDLSKDHTRSLFNPEFVDAMNYYNFYENQKRYFIDSLKTYTEEAAQLFSAWYSRGIFFYTGGHPKTFVIEGILRQVLANSGISMSNHEVSNSVISPFAKDPILPYLNHPVATNLVDRQDQFYVRDERILSLTGMIDSTFGRLEAARPHLIFPDRILDQFDKAYLDYTGRAPEPMVNPYGGKPSRHFWSRVVAQPAVAAVTPGNGLRPVIGQTTKVATAGSCFAQHVAHAMVEGGLTYYVAETAPDGMDAETAEARGYGLFSARYGNIYSTRQLLQLIRRAYGRFTPVETAWPVEGGFIDPFRPNIGETFASVAALEAARADHLAQVRRLFETLDVFVFTLGLTEGWVDRRDGAAYPVTPGAVTKQADPAHFAFQNLDYPAVKADIIAFLGELFAVNPKAQVVLTVSPVPLIATYGADDALSATTYSKSVLRAVAGDVAALFDAVQYFPAYEIITGGFNRGAYFEADLRGVRHEGVDHVMRVFRERLVTGAEAVAPVALPVAEVSDSDRQSIADEIARQMNVVCDEELQVRGL